MRRIIRDDCPSVAEPVNTDKISNLREWLQTQAAAHGLKWLLAHAADGVIWGEFRGGQLVTSDSVAPEISPPLQDTTLQQARLFSPQAELLLWRDGDNAWQARLMRKPADREKPTFTEAIDEQQMLWGTYRDNKLSHDGFTVVYEGQGLSHAAPVEMEEECFGKDDNERKRHRPLRLYVRHYIGEDENGFARIAASRLVDLKVEAAGKEEVAE